jgi:pSer/pThr/pTyr-binding forkhead associated (FHA) protein
MRLLGLRHLQARARLDSTEGIHTQAAQEAALPRLQILNGKRQGAVFDLAQGTEHVIGHRQSASITIDDPWVSWDHARIFFNEEEHACWIEDLGSTNGTYVNCVRVKREPLRHEDIVFLGKTHVIFLSPAEEHQDGVAPIFGSSSEGESIPLSSASQPGAEVLSAGSSAEPFARSDPHLPLRDPFQSAPSQTSRAIPGRGKAPFSDSGVDPFSAGPDYAAAMRAAPAPPPPPGSGSFRGLLDPEREARSLSETNSDDNAMIAPGGGTDLHLSRLDDEDLDVSGPSAAEISRLITGNRGPSEESTQRKPQPQPRAQVPRPSPPKTLSGRIPAPRSDPHGDSRRMAARPHAPPPAPSARETARQPRQPAARHAPPPAARPAPPPPAHQAPPPAARQAPPPPPPGDVLGMPDDVGKLAFERARLEDTVRRLRAALEAATKQNPQAVQLASQALRDQELARQARRIAELERDLAQLRHELTIKQDELDHVTEDMIEREDTIDSLRAEIDRLSSRVAVPQRPRQQPPPGAGASSYDSLPF